MKLFGQSATMQDVIRERPDDASEIEMLRTMRLPGRVQTLVRAVPSTASDVIAGDAEGDVVTDATYIYTIYSISGTLLWDRRAHSAAW